MAYSDLVVRRAKARLTAAKEERESTYAEHLEQAYRQYPRLQEIDLALRKTAAAAVCTAISRGEDPIGAIEALRDQNLSLQKERQWLLESSELEDGFLDDSPICDKCGGSGYVGAQMCECLRELCRQEQKRELTSLFITGKERFDNFSLQYYSDVSDADKGVSPRQMMKHNLAVCKKYAADFREGAGNLLFSGATGLGKTFLSACIGRVVADNGFSVVYETASKIVTDFETVKFNGADDALLKKYFDCDLLILDDLGTELTTQFAVSVFYMLINSRMITGRSVIISTNLEPDKLASRYSPQIASRIFGNYKLLAFLGEDIRLMKQ